MIETSIIVAMAIVIILTIIIVTAIIKARSKKRADNKQVSAQETERQTELKRLYRENLLIASPPDPRGQKTDPNQASPERWLSFHHDELEKYGAWPNTQSPADWTDLIIEKFAGQDVIQKILKESWEFRISKESVQKLLEEALKLGNLEIANAAAKRFNRGLTSAELRQIYGVKTSKEAAT